MEATDYMNMVLARTGLKPEELVCPREKSEMTPCAARDGDCVMTLDKRCVGCRHFLQDLLDAEMARDADNS